MNRINLACVAIAVFLGASGARATTIGFEQFTDSEILTNQIPGLTFSNTIVLTAGISLNEFEFPPHSGGNVVSDDGAPIVISFASPVFSFSGFFTYTVPLALAGFDSGHHELASAHSLFSSNLAISGDPGSSPNEFLQIGSIQGISEVDITGAVQGGSFAMDDISSSVPEPRSAFFLLAGLAALLAGRKRKPA